MGKLTISMAIFNSFLYVYQVGYPKKTSLLLASQQGAGRMPVGRTWEVSNGTTAVSIDLQCALCMYTYSDSMGFYSDSMGY